MKKLQDVVDDYKSYSVCINFADIFGARLVKFLDGEQCNKIGFTWVADGVDSTVANWTEEAVSAELKRDLAMAWEAELNQNTATTVLIAIVKNWCKILENNCSSFDGRKLLIAVDNLYEWNIISAEYKYQEKKLADCTLSEICTLCNSFYDEKIQHYKCSECPCFDITEENNCVLNCADFECLTSYAQNIKVKIPVA